MDNNPWDLPYVRDALTREGYEPVVTRDPAAVPRLMAEQKHHLALLDLGLAGADALQLVQAAADVPVVLLSGYGRDWDISQALGASDYLVKPFSPTGWRRGWAPPCAGAWLPVAPNPAAGINWATWPSTTTCGKFAWRTARWSSRPRSSTCCACCRSTQGEL